MASRARTPEYGRRDDYEDAPPPRRATASQYTTRKEMAELKKRTSKTTSKAPAKPKAPAKKAAPATKRRRVTLLPRVTKQSGQTVLIVPLPRLTLAPVVGVARSLRRVAFPRVGMRALAATAFFGAIAYSLVPSALSVLRDIPGAVGDVFRSGVIASTFSPEVQRWSGEIAEWSQQYGLDPNLMATVMQIESCGHPTVASYAGAQGLFQVMPFHFADGEIMTDPDTNAMRGAGVLNECLRWSNGNIRGALACYNGGPSLLSKPTDAWPNQTQRYVVWGEGIYADAQANADSATLDAWLRAGGQSLCNMAANTPK